MKNLSLLFDVLELSTELHWLAYSQLHDEQFLEAAFDTLRACRLLSEELKLFIQHQGETI